MQLHLIDKMKKLLFLLNILILSALTSCVDKDGEPTISGNIDYSSAGMAEGYAYMDLGLSVMWATCNVGAQSPEYHGDYFAWGETQRYKTNFTKKSYKWFPNSDDYYPYPTKYTYGDNKDEADYRTVLELSDDAANMNWGGNWRMPTPEEIEELINNCTWTWGSQKAVYDTKEGKQVFSSYGYKVKSKINGKSIFIPASGYSVDGDVHGKREDVIIWSCAKPCEYGRYTNEDQHYAYSLSSLVDSIRLAGATRYCGIAVRPVLAPDFTYTISFNANGAVGKMPSITVQHGELIKLPLMSYKCRGFVGWNTKEDGSGIMYEDGAKLTVTSDTELFAQWVRLSCEELSDANGHEYVDLGLSVKWATCNLGASSPEELGEYYAWGEVQPKESYSWENYKWCNGNRFEITKYYGLKHNDWQNEYPLSVRDGKLVLDFEDDAARVQWGGTWSIPTNSEINELTDPNNCVWIKSHRNGVAGYEVVSQINGNSIFLPFAGYKSDNIIEEVYSGFYWTNSIDEYSSPDYVRVLNITKDNITHSGVGEWFKSISYWRSLGMLIRPVLL